MRKRLRLLELASVPQAGASEFRASGHWLATLLVGAVVGFFGWVGWRGGYRLGSGALPGFIAWWIVFWLGLYWFFLAQTALKSLKPEAWLVRADGQGLYVKWRSYQNVGWGREGLQVVFIPYSMILTARRHKRRWYTPSSRHGGMRQESNTFVELQLFDADSSELAARLAAERSGKPIGEDVKKVRWGHFPVSVEPGDVVRIEWQARPGVDAILALLRENGVDVAPDASSKSDLVAAANDSDLGELARRGDLMALVRVLRVRDDLDLEEAHRRAKAMIAEARLAG